MTEPVLTEGDRNNATWLRLKNHLEAKLASLREQNDKDLSELKSARLRGYIECVKDLIALGDVPTLITSDDHLFKD